MVKIGALVMADDRRNLEELWHPIWVEEDGVHAGADGQQTGWPSKACLLGEANLQGGSEGVWERGALRVSSSAIRPTSFTDTRKSSTLSTWRQCRYYQLKSAEPFVAWNPLPRVKTFLDDSTRTQCRHRLQSQCLSYSRIASGEANFGNATPFGRFLGDGLSSSGCSAWHKRLISSVGCERASRDSPSTRSSNAET